MSEAGLGQYFKNLSDYEEIRKLGQGACGVVFLAREKASGAMVALKKINEIGDPQDQRSFIREVIVPLRINLPGIVRLIGFRWPEIPDPTNLMTMTPAVIITELMPNGTLDEAIKAAHSGNPKEGFGPTELSKAIFGVAATMAQVHAKKAIHRDLKPGNIFLDENWEPRIADFGLARIVTNSIKMTMAIGSPLFMAPELYDDEDKYTYSVDVYAFAVLMYTSFTSKQNELNDGPIRSPQNLMMRVSRGSRLKRQDGITDKYWELIEECWKHAPAERPDFAAIVDKMNENDDFALPGTDLAKYKEYRTRILEESAAVSGADIDAMLQSTAPRVHTKQGLRMSDLAKADNPLFASQFTKSMTKSMAVGGKWDQAYSRYDFTRSKYLRTT
jgi:serine/threonine protein kinase